MKTQFSFPKTSKIAGQALALGALLTLAGCAGTAPQLGGAPTVATGSAGGATANNANTALEKCDRSLGTLSVRNLAVGAGSTHRLTGVTFDVRAGEIVGVAGVAGAM